MSFLLDLEKRFPNRAARPADVTELRAGIFYCYILTADERPIVVGHGRRNRARVVFDSEASITPDHIKALTVRLYLLFAPEGTVYGRYLIRCDSKEDAREVEASIHAEHGGNTRQLPEAIEDRLLRELDRDSVAFMIVRMALCSAFDGISDLRRWRKAGIINDGTWVEISNLLKLPFDL